MFSTLWGLLLGVVMAAVITVFYGDRFNAVLSELVVEPETSLSAATELKPGMPVPESPVSGTAIPVTRARAEQRQAPAETTATAAAAREASPTDESGPASPGSTLARKWADYAARAGSLQPQGDFRWRECFTRAAAAHDVPETLLLALASGESGFDPAARSAKDAVGLMQIRWPRTSRHLGINREADLYDPCTNIAAGARYIAELSQRYDNDLHRAVAAYNYGPGRINSGALPAGARWYSQYIYQHLQKILGQPQTPSSELLPAPSPGEGGFEVLMSFNQAFRARDFIAYLQRQEPTLDLAQRSEALGRHEVVVLYDNAQQRRAALEAIGRSGITTAAN